MKEFYENINNDEDSPLLKLGHGSGFLATTLGLKVKNNNMALYNEIKDMIVKQKRSEKNNKVDDFPVTRLINESDKRPVGWVRLTFKE